MYINVSLFHIHVYIILSQMNHIERLQQKLSIMSYIANFSENIKHLKPVSQPYVIDALPQV